MYRKFCCARFGIRHEASREEGMNLRVVKRPPDERPDGWHTYRFYVTPGYRIGQEVKRLNIRYCPFCGTDLYAFYRSDQFVNEEPDIF